MSPHVTIFLHVYVLIVITAEEGPRTETFRIILLSTCYDKLIKFSSYEILSTCMKTKKSKVVVLVLFSYISHTTFLSSRQHLRVCFFGTAVQRWNRLLVIIPGLVSFHITIKTSDNLLKSVSDCYVIYVLYAPWNLFHFLGLYNTSCCLHKHLSQLGGNYSCVAKLFMFMVWQLD